MRPRQRVIVEGPGAQSGPGERQDRALPRRLPAGERLRVQAPASGLPASQGIWWRDQA